MKRHGPDVTFTFVNPNSPREVQKLLKALLVEKLLAVRLEEPAEAGRGGR